VTKGDPAKTDEANRETLKKTKLGREKRDISNESIGDGEVLLGRANTTSARKRT